MDHLVQHIESLIFTAESPIAFAEIRSCLQTSFDTKFKKPPIQKAIDHLKEKYQQEEYSFELVEIGGGYQFLTKAAFHNTVGVYLKQTTKKRLSKAALETLSIIAYKQPVPKSEMEKIRGVSCDYSVQKLLEKELITIVGRADGPGKPLLYGTSEKFMDYFGLKDIEALPKPKDFKEPDNEIGEKAPIDEDRPVAEETPPIEASIPTPPPSAGQAIMQEAAGTDWEPPKSPMIAEDLPPSSGETEVITPENKEAVIEEEITPIDDAEMDADTLAEQPTDIEEHPSEETDLTSSKEVEELPLDTAAITSPTPTPPFIPSIDINPELEKEETILETSEIDTPIEEIAITEDRPKGTPANSTPPTFTEEASTTNDNQFTKPGSVFQEVISIIAPPLFMDEDVIQQEEEAEGNRISGDTTSDDFEV